MCVAPISLKTGDQNVYDSLVEKGIIHQGSTYVVPCGKCYVCRRALVNQWVFRLQNEFKASTTHKAYFLSLTYEDQYLEEFKMIEDGGLWTPNGNLTLNYDHIKAFPKKIRKIVGDNAGIKYYNVGEYGSSTGRPHFHSIIFNANQQEIIDSWKYGAVHFGDVNEATITYTLKYLMKRIGRTHDPNYREELLDRMPEKALISKGIGKEWCETASIKQYYKEKLTRNVIKENGIQHSLPRYYRERLFTEVQQISRAKYASEEAEKKYTNARLREKQAKAAQDARRQALSEAKRKISGVD